MYYKICLCGIASALDKIAQIKWRRSSYMNSWIVKSMCTFYKYVKFVMCSLFKLKRSRCTIYTVICIVLWFILRWVCYIIYMKFVQQSLCLNIWKMRCTLYIEQLYIKNKKFITLLKWKNCCNLTQLVTIKTIWNRNFCCEWL